MKKNIFKIMLFLLSCNAFSDDDLLKKNSCNYQPTKEEINFKLNKKFDCNILFDGLENLFGSDNKTNSDFNIFLTEYCENDKEYENISYFLSNFKFNNDINYNDWIFNNVENLKNKNSVFVYINRLKTGLLNKDIDSQKEQYIYKILEFLFIKYEKIDMENKKYFSYLDKMFVDKNYTMNIVNVLKDEDFELSKKIEAEKEFIYLIKENKINILNSINKINVFIKENNEKKSKFSLFDCKVFSLFDNDNFLKHKGKNICNEN